MIATRKSRRQAPPKKAARKRRKNGAAADARELFEQFHGKESTGSRLVEIPDKSPTDLADLGKLIELSVWLDEDLLIDLNPKGNVRCTCRPTRDRAGELYGSQIYFIGGDQSIDLAAIGLENGTAKDHLMIGPCQYIAYFTSKDFHDFKPSEYEHQFGEETGELPFLGYDVRNQRVYLIGGEYRVERPGIIN